MTRNNSSTVVSLRIPNELMDKLPGAIKKRTGKTGTGRNAAIVEILRRAYENKQPESDSSPASFTS